MIVKDRSKGDRSFGVFLAHVRDGELHSELSDVLGELIDKLTTHANARGKAKGKLAINLSFDVDDRGVVEVKSDVKVVEPKPERGKGVFWIDAEGNLTAKNPRQTELALREVSSPPMAKEPATVSTPARSV